MWSVSFSDDQSSIYARTILDRVRSPSGSTVANRVEAGRAPAQLTCREGPGRTRACSTRSPTGTEPGDILIRIEPQPQAQLGCVVLYVADSVDVQFGPGEIAPRKTRRLA